MLHDSSPFPKFSFAAIYPCYAVKHTNAANAVLVSYLVRTVQAICVRMFPEKKNKARVRIW